MQLNNLYKLIKITINIAVCIKINTINWLCYANIKNTLYNYVNYIQLCFIFIILIMLIIIIIVKTNQNMLPLIPNKLRVCKLLLIILQLLLIIKLKFNNI